MDAQYHDSLAWILSLSGDFISTYIVDLATEDYIQYKATRDYKKLGLATQGSNFFAQKGVFTVHYRLLIGGEAKPASTRIFRVTENDEDKLIVGIRV